MGFAKPIEQYLNGSSLTKIQGFMYLKDIIREEVECVEWFDMEELNRALQPPRDHKFCVPSEGFQIAKKWCESNL